MDLHDSDEGEATLSGQNPPNKQVRASYWIIPAWAIICRLATIELSPTEAETPGCDLGLLWLVRSRVSGIIYPMNEVS